MYNKKRRFHKMNYNDLATKAHENAVKHGFWERKLSNEHCLCLVLTEVCEAVEADRKGNHADYDGYSKMPNKQVGFEQFIKSSVEDELADVAIRLADLAGALGVDFTKMQPCRYYRAFGKFSFTENAFALCKGLSKDAIGIEKRIQFGLDYVFNWAHYNGIDLAAYIEAKMRYNIMRPIRHGKKY